MINLRSLIQPGKCGPVKRATMHKTKIKKFMKAIHLLHFNRIKCLQFCNISRLILSNISFRKFIFSDFFTFAILLWLSASWVDPDHIFGVVTKVWNVLHPLCVNPQLVRCGVLHPLKFLNITLLDSAVKSTYLFLQPTWNVTPPNGASFRWVLSNLLRFGV